MTTTIAVAGKGGTGKTTVAALIIRYLGENFRNDGQRNAVLAIDADPSSNLNDVLGLQVHGTIGDIREDMLDQVQASSVAAGAMPGGMSKQDYLDYQIRMALVEGDHVDLLAMGRPEGPGCYCAANQMMRVIVDRMGSHYDYVVIDNEAGMEHISRRTTRNVDHLLLVTDLSQRGVTAVQRIVEMVPGLDVSVAKMYLIVNRVTGDRLPPPLDAVVQDLVQNLGIELIGTIPNDALMSEYEFSGRPLIALPRNAPVVQAVYRIVERCKLNVKS
jgi:CO dehydrogenase maturation factor